MCVLVVVEIGLIVGSLFTFAACEVRDAVRRPVRAKIEGGGSKHR